MLSTIQRSHSRPLRTLTNPQTLNLYAMVADNPESFADLDGHCDWCQRLKNWAEDKGWRTNQEVKDTASALRKSVGEGESVSLYHTDTGKLETYTHDQISKMTDAQAAQLSDSLNQAGQADEETLAKVAEITGQAIAAGTAVLPNANPSWGRNQLVKELHRIARPWLCHDWRNES